MKKYLLYIICMLVNIFCCMYANDSILEIGNPKNHLSNEIRLGNAKVEVYVNILYDLPKNEMNITPDTILDKIRVTVTTNSIFSKIDKRIKTSLTRTDNTFQGFIPLEMKEQIGLVRLDIGLKYLKEIPVTFNQSTVIKTYWYINSQGNLIDIVYEDSQGLNLISWTILTNIFQIADWVDIPRNYYIGHDDIFTWEWQKVQKLQTDSLWPRYKRNSIYRLGVEDTVLRGTSEPSGTTDWVNNNLKMTFVADAVLPFVTLGNRIGYKIDNPPMEAYSFLDKLDYSPDVFLLCAMQQSIRYILKGILQIPGSGIEEIGETPVAKWQKEVRQILAPAIKEPTKLLMDLLAGMSYVLQIDKGIPLSEEQISNIDKGFTDDIGKIVLSYNTDLARRAQKN